MDLICSKCNYVLDLDVDVDTGECPKCQGMVYQEGDVIDDYEAKRYAELMAETYVKLRFLGNGPFDQN